MSEIDQDQPARPPRGRVRWLRDWRVLLGLTISIVCIWYVLRDAPLREVRAALARADLLLLLTLSIPPYVLSVWIRALRWRHLTNPLGVFPRGVLFRAVAIGFMVNNLLPLRIGELVRSLYLARETNSSRAAVLGTVALERVIDVVSLLLIAGAAFVWMGGEAQGSAALSQGARLLLPVALLPLVALIALKLMPQPILRAVRLICTPLPERWAERLVGLLQRFTQGLGAISGGSHLFWITLHSGLIWLVLSTLPVLAGILAFGLELGSPMEHIGISWILLGATGVAVAIPSAPGFFGPYQLAFKEVLERFGVDPATALAIGLLVWLVFWLTFIVQGFLVVRLSHASLVELTRPAGKDPSPSRR